MPERLIDRTGNSYPACQDSNDISYVVIPESQLTFMENGEHNIHHFGPQRDYECSNCGCEWLMSDEVGK